MSAFTPIAERLAPLVPNLAPLLGKLASDHDPEILASVRAIRRLLERHSLSLNDLGRALEAEPVVQVVHRERHPEPDAADDGWLATATYCAARSALLNEREAEFVASMCRIFCRPGATPTERQAGWLQAIYARLWEENA